MFALLCCLIATCGLPGVSKMEVVLFALFQGISLCPLLHVREIIFPLAEQDIKWDSGILFLLHFRQN